METLSNEQKVALLKLRSQILARLKELQILVASKEIAKIIQKMVDKDMLDYDDIMNGELCYRNFVVTKLLDRLHSLSITCDIEKQIILNTEWKS